MRGGGGGEGGIELSVIGVEVEVDRGGVEELRKGRGEHGEEKRAKDRALRDASEEWRRRGCVAKCADGLGPVDESLLEANQERRLWMESDRRDKL